MASVLQQLSTLFVLAFAVYFVNGWVQTEELRRYSSEDHSIEDHSTEDHSIEDDRIYLKPATSASKPEPGVVPFLVGEGQRPSKVPIVIQTDPSFTVEDPTKPLPSPVPIYLAPSNDGLPPYRPHYTDDSGETIIFVDGHKPSHKPATIGLPPAPPVEGSSKPSSVPIYVVPSKDGLPPYRPPYTDDSGETIIFVDGHKPSHKPATIGLPPAPPVEGPSKPSPVPIYVVPSNDGLPPYRPSYTDDSGETIIFVDGHKPSHKPAAIGLPPAPPVEGPSKPSPVPINVVPSNGVLPPYRPSYTDDSGETIIFVDGHKPSHKPAAMGLPPAPPVEGPSKPSPVPINVVPSNGVLPPYRPSYTDDSGETIIFVDAHKPSHKPAAIGLPPAPPVEGPSKPSPVPINVVPSNGVLPPYRPSYTDDSGETIIFVDAHKPSHKPAAIGLPPAPPVEGPSKPSPVPIYVVPSNDGLPPYWPSYTDDSGEKIIFVDGHKPSHKPATIGLPPAPPLEGPSKPSPVPIYVVPSNDGLPPYRPSYTDDSGETIIFVDGHKPSHKPAAIGLPPAPPVEGPSKPSPVPINVVPSNGVLPPYRPSYTDDSGETIIFVDGHKPSHKPAAMGLPPAPPLEGPSKPSPVPIYVVPSNDGLPPYRPPYTDDSRETIIFVDGHKPSHKPGTIGTHPVLTGPSKPLQSPAPIDPIPSICGRKNSCYQWFDDKFQLSSDGYELCDAKDEIYARRFCCVH